MAWTRKSRPGCRCHSVRAFAISGSRPTWSGEDTRLGWACSDGPPGKGTGWRSAGPGLRCLLYPDELWSRTSPPFQLFPVQSMRTSPLTGQRRHRDRCQTVPGGQRPSSGCGGRPRRWHVGPRGPAQPMPRPHHVGPVPEAGPPRPQKGPSLQGHSTSVVQVLFSTTFRNTRLVRGGRAVWGLNNFQTLYTVRGRGTGRTLTCAGPTVGTERAHGTLRPRRGEHWT